MEILILFTLCYFLCCLCLIFPSPEFVSVGLTVEYIFSFWLKTEAECFIHHHLRRTVATLIVHSLIPLGYVLGMKYICPQSPIWDGYVVFDFLWGTAVTLPLMASSIAFRWYQQQWRDHPIAIDLRKFTSGDNDINRIARDIDEEFRSTNKIIIKSNALTRVLVTDNWIIKISPYFLDIAHQSDASLVVSSSDSHLYVPDRPAGSQYLNIDVKSSRANVHPFKIRVNSADFKDLQEKMIRPINIKENVKLQGSLTDHFLSVFKEKIKENPKVLAPENLDVCMGCLLATPNVKLMTSCGDVSGPDKCSMCYCKPLWCADCMGKWFASRQDQETPDNWLSSKATCPMCRSTFCLLDVCPLESSKDN